jgi:hypothetical protein
MAEGFVAAGKESHDPIRLDRDSALAVEFNFKHPVRALWQFCDRQALHGLNECGRAER